MEKIIKSIKAYYIKLAMDRGYKPIDVECVINEELSKEDDPVYNFSCKVYDDCFKCFYVININVPHNGLPYEVINNEPKIIDDILGT